MSERAARVFCGDAFVAVQGCRSSWRQQQSNEEVWHSTATAPDDRQELRRRRALADWSLRRTYAGSRAMRRPSGNVTVINRFSCQPGRSVRL